jgi:hypothetical protein
VRRRRLSGACAAVAAVALGAMTLDAAPASAAFGDTTLREGSTGRDVRVLQRWLGYLGHEVTIDGHYGRRTTNAVRRYERRHGLRVDGIVTPAQARGLRARARQAYAGRVASGGAPAEVDGAAVPTTDGARATLSADGRTAIAPASAPEAVKAAIAAANAITRKPYRWGGGHGSFEDTGYDCSGAVSYVLHGAGLLRAPRDSTGLMSFGAAGAGEWITIYAHRTHAYMVIAGLRFDTSGRGESGPRWRPEPRSSRGFVARHPQGL